MSPAGEKERVSQPPAGTTQLPSINLVQSIEDNYAQDDSISGQCEASAKSLRTVIQVTSEIATKYSTADPDLRSYASRLDDLTLRFAIWMTDVDLDNDVLYENVEFKESALYEVIVTALDDLRVNMTTLAENILNIQAYHELDLEARERKKQDHASLKTSFRNATEEIQSALLNLADMRYPLEDFCTGSRERRSLSHHHESMDLVGSTADNFQSVLAPETAEMSSPTMGIKKETVGSTHLLASGEVSHSLGKNVFYGRYRSLYGGFASHIVESVERYCFLCTIGDFPAADELWTTDLSLRPLNFLYLATRVEALLCQSRYGDAGDYLSYYLARPEIAGELSLTDGQLRLFHLLNTYCQIFTLGRLRKAVREARRAWSWLSGYYYTKYDDVQIYIVQIYLDVIEYAQSVSTFTTPNDLTFPPGTRPEMSMSWVGFETWLAHLQERDRFWQALAILKIIGPPQTVDWGSKQYQLLIEAIPATSHQEDIDLCRVASLVSYSRLLSSKGKKDGGIRFASDAADILNDLHTVLRIPTPRQVLELKLAFLESSELVIHPDLELQKWSEIVSLAEASQDYGIQSGIQSLCLYRCMQTATGAKMHTEIDQHQKKLEEIEKNILRNMSSVLIHRSASWHFRDITECEAILEWFESFDKQFPTSGFLLGDAEPEDELMAWDVPIEKAREEQFKYMIFFELQQPELARKALYALTQILKHVPLNIIREWAVQDHLLLEWHDPRLLTVREPVDVLARRIRLCFASSEFREEQNEWARYKELNSAKLKAILFSRPFSETMFTERLSSLQAWFSTDKAVFVSESSEMLIAQLMMAQIVHAKETTQPASVIASQIRDFVKFVDLLPETSLKQHLKRKALIARQQLLYTEPILWPSELRHPMTLRPRMSRPHPTIQETLLGRRIRRNRWTPYGTWKNHGETV